MAFKVNTVDPSATTVQWETYINQIDGKSLPLKETFHVTRLNPFALYLVDCILFVTPATRNELYSRNLSRNSYKAKLNLYWYRVSRATITDYKNWKEERNSSPDIHHLPRAISFNTDKGETVKLRTCSSKSFDRGIWEADTFFITVEEFASGGKYSAFPLAVVFMIQFESNFSRGERNILSNLSDLFVQQINCDVQFCFGGDLRVGAHTSILAARSSVFASILQQEVSKVDIEDSQPDVFIQLLHFVYSGRTLTSLNEKMAQLLYEQSYKYGIDDLTEECVGFLMSYIRRDNVINLMTWAEQHSIANLKEATRAFAGRRGIEVATKQEEKDLSFEDSRDEESDNTDEEPEEPDVQSEMFNEFLQFIYSSPALLDEITLESLLLVADLYDIGDMREECVDFLLRFCIRVDNVLDFLSWGHDNSMDDVVDAALNFITYHCIEICQLDEWDVFWKTNPDVYLFTARHMMENRPKSALI